MEAFDVVVIGGGPGGYPAAIRAAQLGASAALVEKEALGGTCLNWGCIPTKTLIAASDLCWRAGHAAELGVKAGAVEADYAAMSRRKDDVVARLRGGVAQLLKGNGVRVFEGTASFADRNRIEVAGPDGSKTAIAAAHTIIATGSESSLPGFLPKSPNVVESRAFLALTALPPRLIVLGGGVIGCEFACMAAQLGAKVTVVELLDDILIMLDEDLRRELRRHMEKALGIRILCGRPFEKVEAGRDGVRGAAGDAAVEGDALLVSVGRRPVAAGLGLERIGLAPTGKGAIEADAFCRTRAPTVYAIGDVTAGSTQLAHAATAQGIAAAENILARRPQAAETLVPACIFTAPEIGAVGLSEQRAKECGRSVKVGKFMLAGLGKAMAAGEPLGFVKWIADAATGQLLGAQAIGAHATELIAEAAFAIRSEATAEELGRTIHCHPTFSEAWMEAAHAVDGHCIHQAPRRK